MSWQGAAISAAAGMFGRSNQTEQNIRLMASAARRYGPKYGFNPLTLLGLAGAGVDQNAGQAPLASLQILGEAIGDEFSQDAKDRREHNRLTNELLTLEVQKARTLSGVAPASAVSGMGGAAPALNGGRTSVVGTPAGTTTGPFQMKILGDREIKQTPTEDLSGFMRVRNGLTDDDGFLIPGSDGEPLDIWQVPVVAGSWAADKAWEIGSKAGDWLATSDISPLQKDRFAPDGYSEDGKPFWKTANGITWIKPLPRDGGKDF